jgi:hypothetical protein
MTAVYIFAYRPYRTVSIFLGYISYLLVVHVMWLCCLCCMAHTTNTGRPTRLSFTMSRFDDGPSKLGPILLASLISLIYLSILYPNWYLEA